MPIRNVLFRDTASNRPHDDIEEIRASILAKIELVIGKETEGATPYDWYVAAALTLRDQIVARWLASERETKKSRKKRVYYLSLEFLIGRLFRDALGNMQVMEKFEKALQEIGVDLSQIAETEPDAALGNGGLGRLAACFMDSMASLQIPAQGYGIRYEHGLFKQLISSGWQEEFPEYWLNSGNPWEFERNDLVFNVQFGGHITRVDQPNGEEEIVWTPAEIIQAVAYDTPIVGSHGRHVNALRLWSARARDPMRLETFNRGDHLGAMSEMARAEAISKFLYPSDESAEGKELRLRQEYFFVSASLQDILEYHSRNEGDVRTLPSYAAIQLNDTHPSLAVPELIRLLVDKYRLTWSEARKISEQTISYTNHTLLPEALESWPVDLFERALPRHLEIIYRLNVENLELATRHAPDDNRFLASVSLIDETGGRRVRMGHLAFMGSHRINGVSEMHSELMKKTVFSDLNALYPGRITNKTNGITFRRWLHRCNPQLTNLMREVCGDGILDDPLAARRLERFSEDRALIERFEAVKRANKVRLSNMIGSTLGIDVDPDALFDIQIKRIHEYKRQLLNALETIGMYLAIRENPNRDWKPRVKIFAGKAAASYHQAKLIIKLINDVAALVNNDPAVRGLLKVVFVPNYNVSAAEILVPACDLSEQISTAGMEASGTGNMKLALNGALTIGTLDGANIEIRDHVGEENMFIFGLTADEVLYLRRNGIDAMDAIEKSPILRRVIDALERGDFSPEDPGRFGAITHSLKYLDFYMVSSDFGSYHSAQQRVDELWGSPAWTSSSILTVARMGWFSSDRTIREYAEDIWDVPHS